jgi:pyruvate formate-lyase activating enzyme-like uncharacterized protein
MLNFSELIVFLNKIMMNTQSKVIHSIQMLDGNICEIVFKDKVRIELNDMAEAFDLVNSFTNHLPVKKLVITGANTEITKEARLFGHEASLKVKDNVIAEAIIVHSLYQKMVINFYSKFIKDNYPTSYFVDIEKAKEWLKSIPN